MKKATKNKIKPIRLMDLILLRDTIKKLGGPKRFKMTVFYYNKLMNKS